MTWAPWAAASRACSSWRSIIDALSPVHSVCSTAARMMLAISASFVSHPRRARRSLEPHFGGPLDAAMLMRARARPRGRPERQRGYPVTLATMTTLETKRSRTYANDRAHVFHSWSAQGALDPLVVAGADGSWFWDEDGHRYLDFSSQLVNLNIGHQHPKLVAAIQEQAGRLCTIAPFYANDARSEAARLIAELAPGDLDMVFFTNGGAEATENAMRMARLHTGRHKVLATYRSYHGATAARSRSPATPGAGRASRACRASCSSGGRTRTGRRSTPTNEAEECERALAAPRRRHHGRGPAHGRRHHARDGGRHERHPRAARRLPRRRAGAVRPATAS